MVIHPTLRNAKPSTSGVVAEWEANDDSSTRPLADPVEAPGFAAHNSIKYQVLRERAEEAEPICVFD